MKLTKSKLKQLVKEALEIHIAPAGLTDMDAKTAYDDREEDAMWGGYVELHKQLYNSSPDTEDMTYDEMMLAYKKLEDYSALKEHAKTRAKGTNHMKLTKSKLKQLIKEELNKVLKEKGREDLRVKNIRQKFTEDELSILNSIYGEKRMSYRRGSQTYGHKDDWGDWVIQPVDGRIHQFINHMHVRGESIEDLIEELKYEANEYLQAYENVDTVIKNLKAQDERIEKNWLDVEDEFGDENDDALSVFKAWWIKEKNETGAPDEELAQQLQKWIISGLGLGNDDDEIQDWGW